jgi:DNA invertase Pin-like site-specific DNA recombinase
MKVFGYLRVSGKGQLHRDGFTRQRLAIEKYCTIHGHQLVQVFAEKAVPGSTDMVDRPEWREMVGQALEGGAEAVVIERLDRLARDLIVQEHIIGDVIKRGLTLLSTAEPDLCSSEPTRILIRQILGAVAAYDKAMIVLKLRGARERMRERTGRCEGAKPYGTFAGEAEVIDRMRTLRANGAHLSAIAGALNADGVRPRLGTQWFPMTVSRILEREVKYA